MRRAFAIGLVVALAGCGDDAAGSTSPSSDTEPDTGVSTSGGADASSGDPEVSYARDVRPIFAGRCSLCHHDMSAIDIDIADPFSAPNGLVGSVNTWAEAYPEGNTPMLNVDPGAPEASFLLNKIGDPAALDGETAGAHMPLNLTPLTESEVASLRQWISNGASNDAEFEDAIRPIFGEVTLGSRSGKCVWCHHDGPGAQRPNLLDPFDPGTGAVGVASVFDPGRMVITPGEPSASVLVDKVEMSEPGALGGPMPPQYEPLTSAEVSTVEAWIAQGAQDN